MRPDYTGECGVPAGIVLGSTMAFITMITMRKTGVIQTNRQIRETGVRPVADSGILISIKVRRLRFVVS
jgi:hypothetical protein